jgi:hypothetical protein
MQPQLAQLLLPNLLRAERPQLLCVLLVLLLLLTLQARLHDIKGV